MPSWELIKVLYLNRIILLYVVYVNCYTNQFNLRAWIYIFWKVIKCIMYNWCGFWSLHISISIILRLFDLENIVKPRLVKSYISIMNRKYFVDGWPWIICITSLCSLIIWLKWYRKNLNVCPIVQLKLICMFFEWIRICITTNQTFVMWINVYLNTVSATCIGASSKAFCIYVSNISFNFYNLW